MMEQPLTMFEMMAKEHKYVRRIRSVDAVPFIKNIHYARRLPNITDAFGLFVNGDLIGIVTYGIPASHHLCIGLAGVENQYRVKELNRLVLKPECNGHNYASYLVSHSLKLLDNRTFVVSYADTAWTHVGYVYQACNFLYTGLSARRLDCYQPEGKHTRTYDKNNHSPLHQTRSRKHRYVYLVGDKRTKKEMRSQLKYEVLDKYPKGDEIRYDTANPKIVEPIQIVDTRKRAVGDE